MADLSMTVRSHHRPEVIGIRPAAGGGFAPEAQLTAGNTGSHRPRVARGPHPAPPGSAAVEGYPG